MDSTNTAKSEADAAPLEIETVIQLSQTHSDLDSNAHWQDLEALSFDHQEDHRVASELARVWALSVFQGSVSHSSIDTAHRFFQEAHDLDPDYIPNLLEYARFMRQVQRYEIAENLFVDLYRVCKGQLSAGHLNMLGFLYEEWGAEDLSLAAYGLAVEHLRGEDSVSAKVIRASLKKMEDKTGKKYSSDMADVLMTHLQARYEEMQAEPVIVAPAPE